MKSFWHGIEKRSDIKINSTVTMNFAEYSVTNTVAYSKIAKIEYFCFVGDKLKTTHESYFECTYKNIGVYDVGFTVFTSVENEYPFKGTVNVTSVSSLSPQMIPADLTTALITLG